MELNMKHIITLERKPTPGMFDKSDGGVFLRTDEVQHRILKDLWDKANGLFWTVNMVDFSKDSLDAMPEHAKRMFRLNNGYQTLMDSGVVGLYNHLALATSSNEVALSYQQIAFMETIHATSYSDGLLQMFGEDATEIIDIVYTDPIVRNRLVSEISYSDELIADPSKQNIALAILATYLLEAIKFPFSFFVTFSINKAYNNGINGFAQLISRIATDELEVHVPTNKYVLKQLIAENAITNDTILMMADSILNQELDWNLYMQQDGPIPGYNAEIGAQFIRYMHNKCVRDLGVDIPTIKPNDTVRWFNHIRNPDLKQVSQQEQKSTQYQKGVMKDDLYFLDERTPYEAK